MARGLPLWVICGGASALAETVGNSCLVYRRDMSKQEGGIGLYGVVLVTVGAPERFLEGQTYGYVHSFAARKNEPY
jgi:hypothetical protein